MDSVDLVQERCDRKIEMLLKRDMERKLDLERDQATKRLANAENEQLGYFERTFSEKRLEIEGALDSAKDVALEKLAAHFDLISKNILTLQKYVAASNLFLRGYDIKIYQQVLQNLGNKSKDLEEELLPKKKFGFKNRKAKMNGITENVNGKEAKVDEVDSACIFKKKLLENTCDFINECNKTLYLGGEDIFKKDIALTNLEKCTVKLFGSPSTLHINSVKNCYIFTGPVSTSIFAENCENCTFVIACQQLRLHSSRNTNIYLHVTSRAIMEDCNAIYLAPYNLVYDNIEDDFKKAGLEKSTNNWMSIDDFNWLNVEKASPHWSILGEDSRVNDWEKY